MESGGGGGGRMEEDRGEAEGSQRAEKQEGNINMDVVHFEVIYLW